MGERVEINCVCDDRSQLLIWRFSDRTEVPQAKDSNEVHFTRPSKNAQARRRGATLVIPKFSVDLNQAVFYCIRDAGNRNANPQKEVTLIGRVLLILYPSVWYISYMYGSYIYHFDTSDQRKPQDYISHIALTTG